jgi:hypothetical protein
MHPFPSGHRKSRLGPLSHRQTGKLESLSGPHLSLGLPLSFSGRPRPKSDHSSQQTLGLFATRTISQPVTLSWTELTIGDALTATLGSIEVFVTRDVEGLGYIIKRGAQVERFHCLLQESRASWKLACREAMKTVLRILADSRDPVCVAEGIVWSRRVIYSQCFIMDGTPKWRITRVTHNN